jgi:hypothetical protein
VAALFETRFRRLPNGLPEYNAVDPETRVNADSPPNPALAWERLEPQPEIVDFFAELYGRYPFESVGGIFDWAPDVGYSLESQTKANYWRIVGPSTVVHEIAHQWFGNAVTLAFWPDIWLNEGFATWSEWIYDERHGGPSAQERFDELYAIPEGSEEGQDLWFPAPAALPGPEALFHTPVYDRGAMTLQALRGEGGRHRLLRAAARLVQEEPLRQRHHRRLHRSRRARERPTARRVLPRLALPAREARELVRLGGGARRARQRELGAPASPGRASSHPARPDRVDDRPSGAPRRLSAGAVLRRGGATLPCPLRTVRPGGYPE